MILIKETENFDEIDIIKYVLDARVKIEEEIDKHIQNNTLEEIGTFIKEKVEKDIFYDINIDNGIYFKIYFDIILLKFTHFFLKNIKIMNKYYIQLMMLDACPDVQNKIRHIFKELDEEDMALTIWDELKNVCLEIIYKTKDVEEKLYIVEFLNNINQSEWFRNAMYREKSIIHIFPALNMGVKALIIINKYLYNKICNQQQDLL